MKKPLLQFMRVALERLANPGRAARSDGPTAAPAQAAQVRAMADAVSGSDPRFAQELYAIAYRHELTESALQAG
jgi:hypothetical protein